MSAAPAKKKKSTQREILKVKCEALSHVIRGIQSFYSNEASESQKQLIETMIGAAIWYMPRMRELWTGLISKVAFEEIGKGKKPTKDHEYPRKIAGTELLKTGGTGEDLESAYVERFGKFTLVTAQENRRLVKFQKPLIFKTPAEAYAKAEIELIDVREKYLVQFGKEISTAELYKQLHLLAKVAGMTIQDNAQTH
jgi:hypothetical protein